MARLAGGSYMAARHERMEIERAKGMTRVVKETLVQILLRGSIVDTDDPDEIDRACAVQKKIAKRIQRELDR